MRRESYEEMQEEFTSLENKYYKREGLSMGRVDN